MTANQLFLIFQARLNVVLATLALVTAGAVLMAWSTPNKYTASATLIVDVRSPDSVFGNAGLPLSSPAYMNTQSQLAMSARVVQLAITSLKLGENGILQDVWERNGSEKQSFERWLIEYIQENTSVSPGKESNTLTLSVSTEWPELSALIANGMARAYIATALAMNVEPAKDYAQLFEQQRLEARKELIEAQARLSDFQRERGIVVVSDEHIDIENARLNELSTALTQIQAERAGQVGRAASAGEAGLLQDPTSNVVLNTLRTQLQQKQSTLAEASARIGENHPEFKRLRAEVAALQTSVEEEIRRSNATLGAGAKAAMAREASIKKALEEQRQRVLELTRNRDSALALKRDLDAAQRQFELLATRSSMSEISSRQTNANAFLVTEAREPTEPSAPGLALITLSGALFGLLLGSSLAVVMELFDQRVRSQDDLNAIDLPALAFISTARQAYQRDMFGKLISTPRVSGTNPN
ncbi:MAG TPA: hypothetical protein VFV43_12800 [Limnobacter sp.]|nr:hypothetical protein [Limnobacter sp.]